MKKILLTEAQYELLKEVLDAACETFPPAEGERRDVEGLWGTCAKAETV